MFDMTCANLLAFPTKLRAMLHDSEQVSSLLRGPHSSFFQTGRVHVSPQLLTKRVISAIERQSANN